MIYIVIEVLINTLFLIGINIFKGFDSNMVGFALLYIPLPIIGIIVKLDRMKVLLNKGIYLIQDKDVLKYATINSLQFSGLLFLGGIARFGIRQIIYYFIFIWIISLLLASGFLIIGEKKSAGILYVLSISEMILSLMTEIKIGLVTELIIGVYHVSTAIKFGAFLVISVVFFHFTLNKMKEVDFI